MTPTEKQIIDAAMAWWAKTENLSAVWDRHEEDEVHVALQKLDDACRAEAERRSKEKGPSE